MYRSSGLFDSSMYATSSGDRANGDVWMIIGLCMTIIVLFLMPYIVVLNHLIVSIHESYEQTLITEKTKNDMLDVSISIQKSEDGYNVYLGDDNTSPVALDLLSSSIEKRFEHEIVNAKIITFQVKGDKDLFYQQIIEVLSKLKILNNKTDKKIKLELVYIPMEGE